MGCSQCNNIRVTRAELQENEGLCNACATEKEGRAKISRDLMTAFGGKGKRGFVQWLVKGKFLQGLKDEADVVRHNDRIDVIEAMVGGPERFGKLLDGFADVILRVAREKEK